MLNKKVTGILLLLITAFLWGTSIVAQRLGSEYIGPFTYIGVRFLSVGIVFLLMYIPAKKSDIHQKISKKVLIISICVGLSQFLGGVFQQLAITYTSSTAKTAFLSSLNVVFVPIVGLFFGKKTSIMMVPIILIAVVGLYFISVSDSISLEISDLLILGSVLSYATQIVLISIISNNISSIRLCSYQFLISGFLALIIGFFTDIKTITNIVPALPSLLYAIFLSAALANLFQAIGLRYVDGTVGGLVLSLQGVFGLFASVLFFNEVLTIRKIIGCCLVLVALVLSQLNWNKILHKNKQDNTINDKA